MHNIFWPQVWMSEESQEKLGEGIKRILQNCSCLDDKFNDYCSLTTNHLKLIMYDSFVNQGFGAEPDVDAIAIKLQDYIKAEFDLAPPLKDCNQVAVELKIRREYGKLTCERRNQPWKSNLIFEDDIEVCMSHWPQYKSLLDDFKQRSIDHIAREIFSFFRHSAETELPDVAGMGSILANTVGATLNNKVYIGRSKLFKEAKQLLKIHKYWLEGNYTPIKKLKRPKVVKQKDSETSKPSHKSTLKSCFTGVYNVKEL